MGAPAWLECLGVGRAGPGLILMWKLRGHIQQWNLGVPGQPLTHFPTAGGSEGVDGSFRSLLGVLRSQRMTSPLRSSPGQCSSVSWLLLPAPWATSPLW